MDSILFDEKKINARNLKLINQKFDEAEKILQSIKPSKIPELKESFQSIPPYRRAVNYIITMMILGWAFFLLGTISVLPLIRVGYEVAMTKYDKFTIAIIYMIYSYYFMSAPFMGIAQISYVMVIFALFNNIDFYALSEKQFPSLSLDLDVPLYVDQGVISFLRTAGYDFGFISSFPQYFNSMKNIDSIKQLAQRITNFKKEFPSMKGLGNNDIFDLLLDQRNFPLSAYRTAFRGGLDTIPAKFSMKPGEFNDFTNPAYKSFINSIGENTKILEQIQQGTDNRNSFIGVIRDMGFFRNRNRGLFAVGAFLLVVLVIISYVSTFDSPLYRMKLTSPEEYKKIKMKLEEMKNVNIESNLDNVTLPF